MVPYNNAFEKGSLALQNLLSPGTALTAATNPQQLSPEERRSIAERMLGEDHGPLAAAVDFITSPWAIAGLVLTAAYPIAGGAWAAGKALNFEAKMASYAKASGPMMHFFQDFHEMFHGTPLPEVFDRAVRENHVYMREFSKTAKVFIDEFEERGGTFTKELAVKLSAKNDGLDKATHPVYDLLEKVTGKRPAPIASITLSDNEALLAERLQWFTGHQYRYLKHQIDQVPPRARAEMVKSLRRLGIAVDNLDDLESYFPHVESLTRDQLQARHNKWLELIKSSGKAHRAQMEVLPERRSNDRLMKRYNLMLPNEDHLEMAGLLTPELKTALKEADAIRAARFQGAAEKTPEYRRYSLNTLEVLSNYTRAMARTHTWMIPRAEYADRSLGKIVTEELANVSKVNPYKANIISDTMIPLVSGHQSWEQALPAMRFNQSKLWAGQVLEGLGIPESAKKLLREPLAKTQDLSWKRLGGMISSHLYASTLSFNPVSPAKNLMQSLVTTIPAVGVKYFAKGLKEASALFAEYRKLVATGLEKETAFKRVFKDFAETDFDIGRGSPMEMLEGSATYFQRPGKVRAGLEKAVETGLIPFTWSERFNRVVAFYGARAKAIAELPGAAVTDPFSGITKTLTREALRDGKGALTEFGEAVNRYAGQTARLTQFGGGPLNSPLGTINWWKPLSQYTQYPLRVAGFYLNEGARDPGIIGRALVGSTAAYYIGKDLFGTDLSDTLAFGSMPGPPDRDGPLGMFPFQSPFVQVLGATVAGAAHGDIEEIMKAAPLAVPGGVGMARAATAVMPEVAKMIGRPYADYANKTPDGRIPVYSRSGSLIGNYSYPQLMAKAFGLGDISGHTEAQLMDYLLQQRDRIRGYKKEYLDAMMANDTKRMTGIEAEYKKAYPFMGDMPIKKSEIKTLQLRREVTRLERVIDTLPPEQKAAFSAVLATSMGAGAESFMGVDPLLLSSGSAASRRKTRMPGMGNPGMPSPLVPQGINASNVRDAGMALRDSAAATGFSPFDGF